MQGLCESTTAGFRYLGFRLTDEMLKVGSSEKNHGTIKEMSALKLIGKELFTEIGTLEEG